MSAPEVRITHSQAHRYALVQIGDRALTCHLENDLMEVRYAAREGRQSGLVVVPLMPGTVSWLDPESRFALAPNISDVAVGVGATAHHALRLRRMLEAPSRA